MTESKALTENMNEVNLLLRKVSGLGLILFYSLCFLLKYLDMVQIISYPELFLGTGISFFLYFVTLFLFRFKNLHRYFHYIFPLQMFIMIAIVYPMFHATTLTFFVWLIPIIYSGLYAHKGVVMFVSLLVMITAPAETYLMGQVQVTDLAILSLIMLIVILRLISMVTRSRLMIHKAEQELEHSAQLQRENQRLLDEVAVTTSEIGNVIQQLNQMTHGTREAMMQIAQGSEHIIISSQASKQILVTNQQFVTEQVDKSQAITNATKQAVTHAEAVEKESIESEEVVSQMATIIQTIDQTSQQATDKAMVLAERTQEIFTISEAITDIAKNVTVVAINASIEASRAGEAGRTFQVVAEQVHQLALKASEAAKAIGELSTHVQDDLSEIKMSMGESREAVRNGVEISQQATEKLRQIESSVEEINLNLQNIAQKTELQQLDANKIETGMRELRFKTDENLTHIETAAASTQETAAIMDEFTAIVARLQERSQTLQRLVQEIG
ncbi:methyl-accepting chemotaxis protein [Brevibacillus ginsengisoli]|uniref:methyl-accepting chemotaxis protein n=1 Tax=Brevibacillus ginsengisoli TaxID=363854 RepID=UPI003CEB2CE0